MEGDAGLAPVECVAAPRVGYAVGGVAECGEMRSVIRSCELACCRGACGLCTGPCTPFAPADWPSLSCDRCCAAEAAPIGCRGAGLVRPRGAWFVDGNVCMPLARPASLFRLNRPLGRLNIEPFRSACDSSPRIIAAAGWFGPILRGTRRGPFQPAGCTAGSMIRRFDFGAGCSASLISCVCEGPAGVTNRKLPADADDELAPLPPRADSQAPAAGKLTKSWQTTNGSPKTTGRVRGARRMANTHPT
jgi:hypothetical protein